MEGGDIDVGNSKYGGQEAMIIFENVFIPTDKIFMDGEIEFAAMLVERFTSYHRRSYVCKSGVGDALIGAAAAIADLHGVRTLYNSHLRMFSDQMVCNDEDEQIMNVDDWMDVDLEMILDSDAEDAP